MKNKIEIKNGIVCKTYASRMDYVKEENLYRKLKGSGLAPELIDSHDGYLEHEYVEGECFLDLLLAAEKDEEQLEQYLKVFFIWYEKYRELSKMTLGKLRFEKFILSDNRLVNLDFEQCKPGYAEDDFARIVAQICLYKEPFSKGNIEIARFFIYAGAKYFEWMPDLLYVKIPKAIIEESRSRGIPVHEKKMEILATLLTSAGIVLAGGDNPLDKVVEYFKTLPRRIISIPDGYNALVEAFDKFERLYTSSEGVLKRIVEAQRDVNQTWTLCITSSMPKIPPVLWDALLSAEKSECAAVVVEANGKLREFPLLMNTGKTRLELQKAVEEGKTSLIDVLSKMPIVVIKLEDLKTR